MHQEHRSRKSCEVSLQGIPMATWASMGKAMPACLSAAGRPLGALVLTIVRAVGYRLGAAGFLCQATACAAEQQPAKRHKAVASSAAWIQLCPSCSSHMT